MRSALAMLVIAAALASTSSARAAFSIADFTVSSSSSVAGAHPDLTTTLTFSSIPLSPPFMAADGNVRDISVNLPPGLIGDRNAVPQCSQSDFSSNACPASAQIGTVTTSLLTHTGFPFPLTMPVYNMEPRNAEETAEIAFSSLFITVHMQIAVRTDSDFGLTANVVGTTRSFAVTKVALSLWGVPADPSHDGSRINMNGSPVPPPGTARVPFLTNPTSCLGPLTFAAKANSYQDQASFSDAEATLPEMSQCDIVPFDPGFSFQPTSRMAGAPSAYESVLTVPQNTNADGRSSAHLKTAVVSLPAGVAINPSGAVGLGGCDDASLHLKSTAPAACPDDAKIGSAVFDVPVLPRPINGEIYLRQPLPGDLFRIVLVADDFGVHLKIPGDVKADPVTGQLTATFDNTPQVPFSKLTLHFDGGPHAALVNPAACGTYTTHAKLTPWSSSAAVPVDSSFTIDQGCGRESTFAPGFSAGMQDPAAGARTTFHLRITRDSGPAVSTIDTQLPSGLLANIKSVPRCPEAQAAVGACDVASQIGRTVVGAGAGSDPVFLPQAGKPSTAVFLAGPYKGAPFSLSIVVPAQAGPFDLGTVVVRAGLYVDPVTAQATVKADPLPTILEGIPLNVRDIRVDIDRPGFMFNPTNCNPQAVAGTITSAAGQAVAVSSPFQAVNCDRLGLTPKIEYSLSGKGQTKDGKHPALEATLTQPAGQSNLKKVKVTLPLALALDPENSQSDALCEFADGRKTIPECPKSSIVGTATAKTPILDQPLTGPVYFIKNIRIDPKTGRQIRTLPTLATVLQGEGVTLVLRATSAVNDDDELVTTFDNIPDAPVSSFKLKINGGSKGILVISDADICKASQVVDQEIDGQSGKTLDNQVTMATSSCRLGVVASSHTSSSLKLRLGGLGAGKVTVSGKGLKTTRRTIARATVATLQPRFSAATKAALARHHDVRIRVKVSFLAKGAKKAKTTTKTLTVHG